MSLILAIETSCDETAAAVIEDGHRIRSNVVASQVEIHRPYGGVFPEVASRQHILDIVPVIQRALTEASTDWDGLDALAVTRGPGLAGSLLVGVNMAKGLATARRLPIAAINHLEGHLYSNWLDAGKGLDGREDAKSSLPNLAADQAFPLLVLLVSGGHTALILMRGHGDYQQLGGTLDDASGEAFDKVARLLGLSYPGGPAIQRAAQGGDPTAFSFPRALTHKREHRFNFSFSGLKTAVLRQVRELDARDLPVADLAASFQQAVVDVLVEKTAHAAAECGATRVSVCGGVAANSALRAAVLQRLEVSVSIPPLFLCTDNAAMIGAAAHYRLLRDGPTPLNFDVEPSLRLAAVDA